MNNNNSQEAYLESPKSKPNSRSSSILMMDTSEDSTEIKRRRLISSSSSSSSSSLNDLQTNRNQHLTGNLTARTSALTDQQQPLSLNNLHIGDKSRQDLYSEQMRLREESKRKKNRDNAAVQQMKLSQFFKLKPALTQERKQPSSPSPRADKETGHQAKVSKPCPATSNQSTARSQVQNTAAAAAAKFNEPLQEQAAGINKPPQTYQVQDQQTPPQAPKPPADNMATRPLPPAPVPQHAPHPVPVMYTDQTPAPPAPPAAQTPSQYQPSATSHEPIVIDDDEAAVDEAKAVLNVCIGMVITDIVVEKPPLVLPKDDQYEIISLESEGKLNTENYSFKVTSRSVPARFYGWVPFKDTRVLGPLVDNRLIWWDSIIPRGKANNARTPLYIILYCRPHFYISISKYFETHRMYLKTPPFYNPACRYSNPHAHLPEAQQQYLQQQQSFNNTSNSYNYNNNYATGYRPYNAPTSSEQELQRQNLKDIESLLSSIPSDVPVINRIKRKKKKPQRKKIRRRVITIGSDEDDDEDNVFQKSTQNSAISPISDDSDENQEEDEEEDEEDDGYVVEGLSINLMDHQVKGISWMIDRENNKSSNGGILADDMGLGKTIQTIGLILSSIDAESQEEKKEDPESEDDNKQDHQMTLIVTPLALIHQWVDEIKNKTAYGKLRVLKHHGPNRTKNPAVFKRYDVVVTTYQVVSSDSPSDKKKKPKKITTLDGFIEQDEDDNDDDSYRTGIPSKWQQLKKGYGPLYQVKWHRIVLDEAQQIKNRQTKSSTSCSELSAVKRWCLTGTPIQNNVDELYSLLRFLKIQPLSDYPTFKKNISIPIQNNQGELAMERLKAVLRAVMLRRTKDVLRSNQASPSSSNTSSPKPSSNNTEEDEPISKKLSLQLPTREKQDIVLQFSDHEKSLYELLRNRTRESIRAMGGQSGGYMNMLCLLLRLRQACDHPKLILNAIDNDKDVLDIVTDVNNSRESSFDSHNSSCELCGKSKALPSEDSSSPFCQDCQTTVVSTAPNDLFKTSTKIRKMIDILKETRENNPGEKTIIFSQFTSMLDLMEQPLKKHGFKFCRYDGSMSSMLREKSLERLKYDRHCTVLLISLKCGSLGLNLTSANRVILMDIWWNPALEEQAIDRVHRIGQRLPVHVTRLLIDNSVELKILALQEKKALLTKGALDHGLVKNAKLTASEIRSLFDL